METTTINGITYKVIERIPVTALAPIYATALAATQAKGQVKLVKAQGGTRVFVATERANGTYSNPIDTKRALTGRGVR
jgi:hypothetical protein